MGRLASDIGGTFTDLVYFDEQSGVLSMDEFARGVSGEQQVKEQLDALRTKER